MFPVPAAGPPRPPPKTCKTASGPPPLEPFPGNADGVGDPLFSRVEIPFLRGAVVPMVSGGALFPVLDVEFQRLPDRGGFKSTRRRSLREFTIVVLPRFF